VTQRDPTGGGEHAVVELNELWDFSRPDESEQRFRALLDTPQADPSARVEILTQIARAQGLQRRFDDAHATLDACESQARALPAAATPAGARPHLRMLLERGRVWNSSGDPARARPLFIAAWERARESGEDALAVDAAHMVAIVASGDERLAWNLRALELAESSREPRARRWRASLLNNLGWTFHDRNDFARSLELFERAVEARVEQGGARELRIARWCVARALRSLGRCEEALARQLELARELESAQEHDGYVDEEIGECLLALGRAAGAAPAFRRAFERLRADPWLAEREPERLARLERLSRA
jgi:tetratricopeptide (TPR) repeat protein